MTFLSCSNEDTTLEACLLGSSRPEAKLVPRVTRPIAGPLVVAVVVVVVVVFVFIMEASSRKLLPLPRKAMEPDLSPVDTDRLNPVAGAERNASLRLLNDVPVLLLTPEERGAVGWTWMEGVVSSLETLVLPLVLSSSSKSIIKAENIFLLEDCCCSVFLTSASELRGPEGDNESAGGGGWKPFRLPVDPDRHVGPNRGRLDAPEEDPLTPLLPVKEVLYS